MGPLNLGSNHKMVDWDQQQSQNEHLGLFNAHSLGVFSFN